MRLFFGGIFIVFAAAELCIIFQLKRRKQKTGLRATVMSFSLISLLTVAIYLFRLDISLFLMILAVVSVFLDSYIGYYQNFYRKSKVVDRGVHCYNTFALSLLFYNIIMLLTEEGGSKTFRALFVLLLGIALGSVHEILEFIADIRHNTQMQKGLKDTNFDIIFNMIGSISAAAAAYFFMV